MGVNNPSEDQPAEENGGPIKWSDELSYVWQPATKVSFDNKEARDALVRVMNEKDRQDNDARAKENRRSEKIRALKTLIYNYFYFGAAWKDNPDEPRQFDDKEELTYRAEKELVEILDAHVENLDAGKIADDVTYNLIAAIGDDLSDFGIVIEKKYSIRDEEIAPGTYIVHPHIRIADIDTFAHFLDIIKVSDYDLDQILSCVIDGTTVRIEQTLRSTGFTVETMDPDQKSFLFGFKKINARLAKIKHFVPDANLQIKHYSHAICQGFLDEYIKFVDLGFVGNLEEPLQENDSQKMPLFLSELYRADPEIDDMDSIFEDFEDDTKDAIALLKRTTDTRLRKKMKAELESGLCSLQNKLNNEKDFLLDHKDYINSLIEQYQRML